VLFHLNPMAGIVEGFRWSILGSQPPHPYAFISYIMAISIFMSGLFYFRKVEKVIADIV
jgi:lipopolysaccharide transport system permease protein